MWGIYVWWNGCVYAILMSKKSYHKNDFIHASTSTRRTGREGKRESEKGREGKRRERESEGQREEDRKRRRERKREGWNAEEYREGERKRKGKKAKI